MRFLVKTDLVDGVGVVEVLDYCHSDQESSEHWLNQTDYWSATLHEMQARVVDGFEVRASRDAYFDTAEVLDVVLEGRSRAELGCVKVEYDDWKQWADGLSRKEARKVRKYLKSQAREARFNQNAQETIDELLEKDGIKPTLAGAIKEAAREQGEEVVDVRAVEVETEDLVGLPQAGEKDWAKSLHDHVEREVLAGAAVDAVKGIQAGGGIVDEMQDVPASVRKAMQDVVEDCTAELQKKVVQLEILTTSLRWRVKDLEAGC